MTTFLPGPGPVEARPSWREERRLDRLAQAEAEQRREDARQQRLFAAEDKRRELKNRDRAVRRQAKKDAAADRAEQLAAFGNWCRDRAEFLVMIPVIGVPGGLAWTGMADYGYQQYGTPGLALPAFSEAAMWVFAMRTTATRKRDPEAPIWHLRLGTAVFTGYSGALNFLHGYSSGGVVSGVTMALISMAGVIAHQITTAGPRKTRKQRRADLLARKTARKQKRAEAAAIDAGIVVIGGDGQARVAVRPGAASLHRRWPLRARLVPARDVQAEISDVTEAALALVDQAEAEAARAHEQARRFAEAAAEARELARRQIEEADTGRKAADERAQAAQRSAEAASARAEAAEARAARTETETRARLEHTTREASRRIDEAEAGRASAVAETDQVSASYRSAMHDLAAAAHQLEQARSAKQEALARAKAAEEKITQGEGRKKRPDESNKDHLLRLYKAHPDYGNPAVSARAAGELASEFGYSPGSARRDVRAHLVAAGFIPAASENHQGEENAA